MRLLRPYRYCGDVTAIDLDELAAGGVRGLLVDLDNTLLPRDTGVMPPAAREWVAHARTRFAICLVSNNWHEPVHVVARDLDLPLVARAVKPLPFALLAGMRRIGVRRRECAIIGDQLFTDVLGGNVLGVRTVLVRPLSTTDLWHTLLLRKLEARIMRGMVVDGGKGE